MGKSVTGDRIIIPETRLSFLHCFEPQSVDGGPLQFSAVLMLAATSPSVAMIQAEEERLAKLAWPDNPAMLAQIRAANGQALKPGVLKAAKYPEFANNFFVSANNPTRPTVVDRNGSPLTAKDGRIYSGCYALAHISLWTQDNQYGQKINANLLGLQFLKDGDAFSGGPAPSSADDFANLDAGEGGEEDPMG